MISLGIDTSNYTSSISAIDSNNKLLFEERIMLNISDGERGLRQSTALFQHLNNIPVLTEKLFKIIDSKNIGVVSVSSKPRPVEGSYMPVFVSGSNIGQVISQTLNVPFFSTSHQEGHIKAGIWSLNEDMSDDFICLHLSGGTTEVLKVKKKDAGFNIQIIGQTLDISAGQLIDRVGVLLGLRFPAGKGLEILATTGSDNLIIPSYVKDCNISFSGAETLIINKCKNYSSNDIAFSVQKCISKTLEKVIVNAVNKCDLKDILLVGGVASNQYIKSHLISHLKNIKLHFGQPQYCSDNAVGVALLGVEYAKTSFNSNRSK